MATGGSCPRPGSRRPIHLGRVRFRNGERLRQSMGTLSGRLSARKLAELDWRLPVDRGRCARSGMHVDGRAASITLTEWRNMGPRGGSEDDAARPSAEPRPAAAADAEQAPFLRVPPFPGARVQSLVAGHSPGTPGEDMVELVRRLKVGGSYWAAQPALPASYVLVR